MTKSVAAFRFSAEKLWQPGFRVYFWTFTFNSVLADWEAMKRFTRFLDHLNKVMTDNDYSGVRVAELHPGGHGVHFHVLVNRRLSIWLVRRVANCYGIGRISCEVADNACTNVSKYLAKYLSKQKEGPLTEAGNSARRWAWFGKGKHTRVRDVENCSPVWIFRRKESLPWLGFVLEFHLRQCWNYGEEVFRAAWFAAKNGKLGDLAGFAQGRLEVRSRGEHVWRMPWALANITGGIPF